MKPIRGYDNYLISAFGHVLNIKTGKFLKPYFNKKVGYYYVTLSKKSIQKDFRIHRLVALAWIDNPLKLPEVNHKYGNKLNNYYLNLEWCTSSQNRIHAFENGLQEKTREHCRRLGKIRVKQTSKIIIQYTLSGKYISQFPSTREAARKSGIHQRDISNCANRKIKRVKEFIFLFAKDLKNEKCFPCFIDNFSFKKAS